MVVGFTGFAYGYLHLFYYLYCSISTYIYINYCKKNKEILFLGLHENSGSEMSQGLYDTSLKTLHVFVIVFSTLAIHGFVFPKPFFILDYILPILEIFLMIFAA